MTLFLATLALANPVYRITAVEQTQAFAGRLGRRVETVLHLEGSAGPRTVRLTRMHTRVGKVPTFRVGDRVTLPDGPVIAPQDVQPVKTESLP